MGWASRVGDRVRRALGKPPRFPCRVDSVPGTSLRRIGHADVDPAHIAAYCHLHYEFVGDRLCIARIAARTCQDMKHTPHLLAELHRLHPEVTGWWFSTALIQNGPEYWSAMAPRVLRAHHVTLHLSPIIGGGNRMRPRPTDEA